MMIQVVIYGMIQVIHMAIQAMNDDTCYDADDTGDYTCDAGGCQDGTRVTSENYTDSFKHYEA